MFIIGDISDDTLHAILSKVGIKLITLSSDGGDTYAAQAIAAEVRRHAMHVHTTGRCMSAALLILAAGKYRRATYGTMFMTHQATSASRETTPGHLVAEAKQAEAEELAWCNSMAKLTKLTATEWQELSKTTHYFNTTDALRYGLIDEIIGDI